MAEYIDGFVLPVQTDSMEDYECISRLCLEVYLEHGATEYREWRGGDMNNEGVRSFNELADPRLAEMMKYPDPPFDCKRLAFGGFSSLVHAAKAD